MSRPRGPWTCLFLPVTWLVSLALLSPSGRPLAPVRERAAGLCLASEAWGSSGVCGLLGTVPSAERAVCPSGEEWRGSCLCSFLLLCRVQSAASPSSGASVRGLRDPRPLGDPLAPGLPLALHGHGVLTASFWAPLPSAWQPGPSPVRRKYPVSVVAALHTRGHRFPNSFSGRQETGTRLTGWRPRMRLGALRLPRASGLFAPFILTRMGVGG